MRDVLSSTQKQGKIELLSNNIVLTMMKETFFCSQNDIFTTTTAITVLSNVDYIIEFGNGSIDVTCKSLK